MGITIEVLSHNEVCTLRIDPIAQNESNGAEAFLIILTGVRTSAFKDRKAAVQSIMNGIFSLFDSFFALNLTTQTVLRIKVGMSEIDEFERLPPFVVAGMGKAARFLGRLEALSAVL